MNRQKFTNRILVNIFIVLFYGCAETYNINPVEQQTLIIHSDKQVTAAINKVNPPPQNNVIKSQAIINFIGKVTLKKANDLTSYIHKQMNEGITKFIININSSGGDSDAGIAAYQYLKQLPISITTYNIGNVQSSAALLYCTGTHRYALPYSFFMLHGSSTTYTEGMSLSEIESLLKLGKIHRQAFVDIFKSCTALSISTLESYFSAADAKYLTVSEAKQIELIDEMIASPFEKTTIFYNITD